MQSAQPRDHRCARARRGPLPRPLRRDVAVRGPGALTPATDPIREVRGWLRAEAIAAFVAGLALYLWLGAPWFLLIPLLLVPDVSMVGYLRGPRPAR